MEITDRDRAIFFGLTKVRLFTAGQVAGAWWNGSKDPNKLARRRLRRLADAGFLEIRQRMVETIPLTEPVFCWTPGMNEMPPFNAIAYALGTRWKNVVPVPTEVIRPTAEATRLFGGYAANRPIRVSEVTHDVHLAAVWLMYAQTKPQQAKRWQGEDELFAGGWSGKLPDALVRRGRTQKIVEFAGRYRASKLVEFHLAFSEKYCYELW